MIVVVLTGRVHCDLLINNICGVFNRQLLDARNSPIITALKINPITRRHYLEKHSWSSTLIPPKSHPQIGRPPKKRKKPILEVDELVKGGKLSKKGGTSTCSNCKQQGHNKRGCKMPRQGLSEADASGKKAGRNKGSRKKAIASGNAAGADISASAPSGSQPNRATQTTQPSGSQPTRVTQTTQPSGSASPIKRTKRTANKYLSPTICSL